MIWIYMAYELGKKSFAPRINRGNKTEREADIVQFQYYLELIWAIWVTTIRKRKEKKKWRWTLARTEWSKWLNVFCALCHSFLFYGFKIKTKNLNLLIFLVVHEIPLQGKHDDSTEIWVTKLWHFFIYANFEFCSISHNTTFSFDLSNIGLSFAVQILFHWVLA